MICIFKWYFFINYFYLTPLYLAMLYGKIEIAKFLMEYNKYDYDINEKFISFVVYS